MHNLRNPVQKPAFNQTVWMLLVLTLDSSGQLKLRWTETEQLVDVSLRAQRTAETWQSLQQPLLFHELRVT